MAELLVYYIPGKGFTHKTNESLSRYYEGEIIPSNKKFGKFLVLHFFTGDIWIEGAPIKFVQKHQSQEITN